MFSFTFTGKSSRRLVSSSHLVHKKKCTRF